MPVKITSLKFLERLQKMRSSANVEQFVARLQVPDDLFWWKFLEFGTGARGDTDTGAYTISAVNAKLLHFFDAAQNKERFEEIVYMPGIPAFHFITSIYGDIQEYQKTFIQEAFKRTGYDLEGVKELVYTEMMPHIKEMIVDSFNDASGLHRTIPQYEREFGRLAMKSGVAFEEGLEVV